MEPAHDIVAILSDQEHLFKLSEVTGQCVKHRKSLVISCVLICYFDKLST